MQDFYYKLVVLFSTKYPKQTFFGQLFCPPMNIKWPLPKVPIISMAHIQMPPEKILTGLDIPFYKRNYYLMMSSQQQYLQEAIVK